MSQVTPKDNINKVKVLRDAETDRFRGKYIKFGGIDWISLSMGCVIGGLITLILATW